MTHPDRPLPDTPASSLDTLRIEIDRIDTALHGLLMERGEIIDRLIAVKARQGGGSAFRPGREADMMRRLVTRHSGILPLASVESIWRIIISTFTYVQAPYTVHADTGSGDAAMRDSARFHFGFTVPLVTHNGPAAVLRAVTLASGDLGLVATGASEGAWWRALEAPEAPKIIARLPFVERPDHAAGLPVFVVAKPLADAAVNDRDLYAVAAPLPQRHGTDVDVVAAAAGQTLVCTAGTLSLDAVAALCGVPDAALTWVGSHARRFEIDAAPVAATEILR